MSAHRFSPLGARNGQSFLAVRYANEILHLHQRPLQSVPKNVSSTSGGRCARRIPLQCDTIGTFDLVSMSGFDPAQWQQRVDLCRSGLSQCSQERKFVGHRI